MKSILRLPLACSLTLGWSLAQAATYTVTSAADNGDPGTLRWAIVQANANPGSTINLQDNLGTITFLSQTPLITAAVTINGGVGNTVSGNNAHRIFFIDAPNAPDAVIINNLTLANGRAKGGGGGGDMEAMEGTATAGTAAGVARAGVVDSSARAAAARIGVEISRAEEGAA